MRGAPLAPGDLDKAGVPLSWLKDYVLVVSAPALRGWGEQQSPACAAAAVAGAVQGLCSLRDSNGAAENKLGQADALEVYAVGARSALQSAAQELSKKLGLSKPELLDALEEHLIDASFLATLRKKPDHTALATKLQSLAGGGSEAGGTCQTASEEASRSPAAGGSDDSEMDGTEGSLSDSAASDALEEAILEYAESVVKVNSGKGLALMPSELLNGISKELARNRDSLVRDVAEWLLARADMWHLTHGSWPCTDSIGSAKMAEALRSLGARHNLKLHVRRFLGRDDEDDNEEGEEGDVTEHPVAETDSKEAVARQWAALRAAIRSTDTALVMHMPNHYSLLFAARQWSDTSPYAGAVEERQILVASPGQQPNTWLDWEDLRDTLLDDDEYVIVAARRVSDAQPGPPAPAAAAANA